MTSKINILAQILALCEGHFDHFQGLKTHFLGFLKVGSELFRSCYGIVFELKRPTFKFVFRSKWGYLTSKIKDLGFYI